MANLNHETGPIAALAAFLHSFADARLKQHYYELQWANSAANPDKIAAARDAAESNRNFRMQLAQFQSDLTVGRARQIGQTRLDFKKQDLQTLGPMRTRDAVDKATQLGGVANDVYKANTPNVVARTGGQVGARLGQYGRLGLIPSGAKTKGGTGPFAGFKPADFQKISNQANAIVNAHARAELDLHRSAYGQGITLGPGAADSLIAFNPRRRDQAYNEAMLSQLRPYLGAKGIAQLQAHVNAGGSISDAFFQGLTQDLPDTLNIDQPDQQPIDEFPPYPR